MVYNNEKEQVYIEIGDRQIGKTSRLIEDILNYVNKTNETVYVMTFNFSTFELIKQRLYHLGCNHTKVKRIGNISGYDGSRIYVDEIFYIRNIDKVFYMRNNMYINGSIDKYALIESEAIKKIKNYTTWRRKNIINNLLKNNK